MESRVKRLRAGLWAHLHRRGELYWAPLLYLLAVYLLYAEVFAGAKGLGWDTIESYWPDLVYFSDQLAGGDWPLWNPFDRGGYPYSSDPQPGIYYPVHWLFAGLGIVFDTGWWMIQLKMLAHHAIAGLCMHAFLRHRGLGRAPAIIGGIALIASTPWLIHKASNLLMPMVWTPLVWIATDRLLARPSFRGAAALAAALYLAGSAGSPPGFFYVLLMSTLYGAFRAGEHLVPRIREHRLWPYGGHLALALAAAAILVLGLLWVGVAPAFELSEHTPRQTRDLNYALSIPLPMWPTIKALLVPTAGQVDAYCGILVLMLGASALVLRPRKDGGAPIFFALAAFFFLSLSFGAELPVLGWLVKHVPGFGLFRISSRYKCLFAPMMAALAAYGAANLLGEGRRLTAHTWKVLAIAGLSLGLVFLLLYTNPLHPRLVKRYPGAWTPIVLSLLAAGLLVSAALHRGRAALLVLAAMPLLILGDPERYWHHQELFLEAKVDHHEDLDRIRELPGLLSHEYRMYDEFVLEQRPGSRLQVRDFRGYPSGDPLDFRRYRDVLAKAATRPELLEAFNVRYFLYGNHHRSGKRSHRIKKDPAQSSSAHIARAKGPVREALHPAPLVAWYGGVVVEEKSRVLDALLDAEDAEGQRHFAVLEPPAQEALASDRLAALLRTGRDAPPSVAGSLRAFEADRVLTEIVAPTDGIVVLNEVHYPGWSVRVDGKRAENLRANYLLRAVLVGPGRHVIEWSYQPPGHGVRSLMYWLSMLALLAAFLDTLGLSAALRRRLGRNTPSGES